jgi:CubicO group peptidase (beta-lactamase class C family)
MTITTTSALDRWARDVRARYGVPALGASLLSVGHDPLTAVTGSRVRGGAEPATPDDRWHIGSCAKAVTATMVARMVQRGQIRWDTPLADLFADVPGRDAGWDSATMAELLTHRAGVPANPTREQMVAGQTDPAPLPDQRTALARRVLAAPPDRPGRFRYSNIGYTLAGAAVERVTGLSFEDALRDDILDPLGITTAGFGPPRGAQPRGHRPRWLYVGAGPAVDPDRADPRKPADNPPVITPAGRLHLSLADWARFVGLFLTPPGDFLTEESIRVMTTPPPGFPQGMGWGVPSGRPYADRIAFAQTGSNLRWVAASAVTTDRRRAALVVCNDGRLRVIRRLARLAIDLLADPHPT